MMPANKDVKIAIRHQWNSWRIGEAKLIDIAGLHWDILSGGAHAPAPQPFVYGYVYCDKIEGDIDHSCIHCEGPHKIKVCIVKKDNDKQVWSEILKIVGPKPAK